ncbi:MAG: protein-(glutamine-N5) methyltransferase, release factor-specific [Candidatus Fraserbacteria bacterium RBG_16_55_9]|uniref:Release factor glutamine methyltransferase n=1 Tax=Fraserbacteria sp. (strain RBG_16_55_9) TaxID=1817864 RepID=A0A1F5V0E0_FRAXR|nr:MAG: protein-(glutamine-N5) methyltransferase, release factor-specific [Candidatus Fraserbacteria bacterium RBG_16_55_9]
MNSPAVTQTESSEWTIRRVLDWTTGYLRRGKVDAARFEAEVLLSHALRVERLELYLHPERLLRPPERARFRELVRQRHAGTPLAYLLGTVEFMNVTLKVNCSTLIPRVETEEMVERILRDVPSPLPKDFRFLDLGTGSGAIAIALAKEWPEARALAVDISNEALTLARENAQQNGVAERVAFACSDWFSAAQGQYHLIVSNPPYIPSEDLGALPQEVSAHEPRKALDGGPRGLREIERIVREASGFLLPGGRLYLEIGSPQAEDVCKLLHETPAFSRIEVHQDLAGRDRIVYAIRRGDP